MKAAVFYGKHDIRLEERPVRPAGAGEVVVKIAYCGICGTDLHIYHGDEGSATTVPPKILGHEMAGVVSEVGAGVQQLQVGDHVAIDPNFYCGHCYYCRSGQEHFCADMNGIGTTWDGGFAEYCTIPALAAVLVPRDLPLEVAAFAEPLACCLHGIDLTKVRVGDEVLLIGGGTIGLVMLQLAKFAGAAVVRLIEPDEKKRVLAAQLGADSVFASSDEYRVYTAVHAEARADRVIECVGKADTVAFAVEAATKGAVVMLFGLTPPDATVALRPFEVFKKELTITASFVNPRTEARAVELLSTGRVKVAELIGAMIPLEKLDEALREKSYRALTKVMVKL